VDAETVLG